MPDQTQPADRQSVLAAIRTAMVEKKMTQAELADTACCHEKTVQNLLGGRSVRDQTLFDVCMVLGLDYAALKPAWSGQETAASAPNDLRGQGGPVAPVYMGAYTREAVDHYIGRYLTVRPAFSEPDLIVAYRTDIVWDPDWPSLLFEEHERHDADFSHRGRLYVPASSMFLHLVSLTKGAMRMVMVSQLDQTDCMRGLITTINRQGAVVVPVSAPIVYSKLGDAEEPELGRITPDMKSYPRYQKLVNDTEAEGFAKVVSTRTF